MNNEFPPKQLAPPQIERRRPDKPSRQPLAPITALQVQTHPRGNDCNSHLARCSSAPYVSRWYFVAIGSFCASLAARSSSSSADSFDSSCGTSLPVTASCKTNYRILATAAGASANWSNFSKKVSSFIKSAPLRCLHCPKGRGRRRCILPLRLD